MIPFIKTDIGKLTSIQPEGWPDIRPSFESYFDLPNAAVFKIEDKDYLIATGAIVYFKHSAWLGHIIVHPSYRKQGIGMMVTRFLIDQIQRQKEISSIHLIATEMGKPLYHTCGFRDSGLYQFYRQPESFIPPVVSYVIQSYQEKYKEQILALDRFVSGEDREMVLGPHLDFGVYLVEDEKLKGFYLPSLRDGLIVATDPESGIALLKIRMNKSSDIVIPEENLAAADYLKKLGYVNWRPAYFMTMGDDLTRNPELIYCRISGNLG